MTDSLLQMWGESLRKKMPNVLFYMWGRFREKLITEHKFYMDQAQKRLLSQFENLEEEVDKYTKDCLDQASHHFNPEADDPGGFYEQAYEEGIQLHQMLTDMHNRTRLSVIAGMFHEWEKQLRSWTWSEINHWHKGENVKKAIHKAPIDQLLELFKSFGWDIKSKAYFCACDRCRLVVNVYKHGDGGSLEKIKKLHPEFLGATKDEDFRHIKYADYSDLVVRDSHISEFSDALIGFWQDVPERIIDRDDGFDLPDWFKKAYDRDIEDHNKEEMD